MLVMTAEPAILKSVLPSSSVAIIRPLRRSSCETTTARRSPSLSSECICARDAPVSAVSEPEKSADSSTQPRTTRRAERMSNLLKDRSRCASPSHFTLQEGQDLFRVDVLRDEGAADLARQHQGQRPALHLLVLLHRLQNGLGVGAEIGNVGKARGQSDPLQMALDAQRVLSVAQAEPVREPVSLGKADRHAFAMHEAPRVIAHEPL